MELSFCAAIDLRESIDEAPTLIEALVEIRFCCVASGEYVDERNTDERGVCVAFARQMQWE
jgi:hypothetical protein